MIRTLLAGWLLLTGFLFCEATLAANPRKHIVYFTDKNGTPFSVTEPHLYLSEKALLRRERQGIKVVERDLPVNPQYVAQLNALGGNVVYTSKWFNAAVVECDSAVLATLLQQSFVISDRGQTLSRMAAPDSAPAPYKPVKPATTAALKRSAQELDYGPSRTQADMLGAVDMHRLGFRGEGITIAVFDAGFPNVNVLPGFSHLFDQGRVKGTFNFRDKETDVYKHDTHGTMVLSTMAAYLPGQLIGTAFNANYYLFITEMHRVNGADFEQNIEEVNWLLAAEFADSAGVDIINSSLGYTTFDFPSRSYSTRDMNGNTALVTRAADLAAATGMLVVNSAGNEGNHTWRTIGAPADGDSVLAVGAVTPQRAKADFSSFGPSADGRIKPDVAAMGAAAVVMAPNGGVGTSSGTSFSGPILCGMAACLWQANQHHNLTNMEMIRFLQQAGDQADKPDDRLGFGIPTFQRANLLIDLAKRNPQDETFLFPNPLTNETLVILLEKALAETDVEITIYDAVGRHIFSQSAGRLSSLVELEFQTGALRNGLYICSVKGKNRQKVLRFVKL